MKRKIRYLLPALLFLLGAAILLYPPLSSFWNQRRQDTTDRRLPSDDGGIGHLAGTSLPIGGAGTHCILTGHSGLPSAKLLTDLDQMRSGDCFFLYVLGEKYTYEVDQVLTVEPDQVEALLPVDGETLVTLVTCTPYGVNTHRLFVRGHLIQVELSPE